MTSDQLQSTRLERWRHQSNPLLTLDDARTWLAGVGLCLFMPRHTHFLASAPSFVEAVDGAPSETPLRAQIEVALERMRRLATAGDAVPLNFFGAAGGASTDQPDFLASREAFPYIFSLVGGRNWKSGPGAKASPLVLEIWKLLNDGAALEATEIQAGVGREVTEGAVLRGLMELWSGARAIPAYEQDGPTRWELTQRRFAAEMTASQKIAQPTALSALVSLYLESAVAASADEVETFLSPLTARSRVREVLNGLNATRQLELVPVGTQSLFAVAGSLPEFAEAPRPESAEAGLPEAETVDRLQSAANKPIFDRKTPRAASDERPRRGPGEGRLRYAAGRPPLGRERASRPGARRAGSSRPERDGERRPWPRKAAEKPGGEGAGSAARPERGGPERGGPGRGSYGRSERPAGERRPYGQRAAGGQRPPFRSDAARAGFRPEGAAPARERPGGDRPRGIAPRGGKFPPKQFGAGKGDAGRSGPERDKPAFRAGAGPERGGKRPYERPAYPAGRHGGAKGSFGGKPKFGDRSPGAPLRAMRGKSGGAGAGGAGGGEKRPFFRKRREDGEGGAHPFRPSGASGRPAGAAGGERGARERRPGREGGFAPRRTGSDGARPGARFTPRPGAGGAGGSNSRPRSKPGFSGGAASKFAGKFGARPAFGKPSFGGKSGGNPGGRFTSPRGPSTGPRSSGADRGGPRTGGTGGRSGSGPGGGAQRGAGAGAGSRPGFKAGSRPASKFGSKPGGKFGSKPGGKFGSKPGGRTGPPPRKRRDKGEGKKDAE